MSLSLRGSVPSTAARTRPASRRPVVAVRAGFFEDIGAGFVRIFTPFRVGNKEEWKGTDTPFTGSISHHGEAGSRRPFRDGWTSKPTPPTKKGVVAAAEPVVEAPVEEGNIVSFLNKAAENVVAHNFTGDQTEPKHWKKSEDSMGWKGDIHTRERDGFHASKK